MNESCLPQVVRTTCSPEDERTSSGGGGGWGGQGGRQEDNETKGWETRKNERQRDTERAEERGRDWC